MRNSEPKRKTFSTRNLGRCAAGLAAVIPSAVAATPAEATVATSYYLPYHPWCMGISTYWNGPNRNPHSMLNTVVASKLCSGAHSSGWVEARIVRNSNNTYVHQYNDGYAAIQYVANGATIHAQAIHWGWHHQHLVSAQAIRSF